VKFEPPSQQSATVAQTAVTQVPSSSYPPMHTTAATTSSSNTAVAAAAVSSQPTAASAVSAVPPAAVIAAAIAAPVQVLFTYNNNRNQYLSPCVFCDCLFIKQYAFTSAYTMHLSDNTLTNCCDFMMFDHGV
jgi:hypothetical protein